MKTVDQIDLAGKRVFIRVDFNVPVEGGKVSDPTRIDAALPTIRHAIERGGRVILASHFGRPRGGPEPRYSLRPVLPVLVERLGGIVEMAGDCIGSEVEARVQRLQPGRVLLLENLRFHAGEEKNDPEFCKALARLADVYVNDAFGAAHRAHASTAGMVPLVAERAAGFLMQRECEYLGKVLTAPERPFVAILGGAKVSDKIGVIRNLMSRVDTLLIGGAMAYTFLRARRVETGKSLVEEAQIGLAAELLAEAAKRGVRMVLPLDHVVAVEAKEGVAAECVAGAVPAGKMGLDVGPRTVEEFRAAIAGAKTVLWNGPLGLFEVKPFDAGTLAIAAAVADSGATSIVGGGDSVSAVLRSGRAGDITHISTGGGASLKFLEGAELPGVAALRG